MFLKKQLSYLKKVGKLAKQKILEIENNIWKEDAFVLFENELIRGL